MNQYLQGSVAKLLTCDRIFNAPVDPNMAAVPSLSKNRGWSWLYEAYFSLNSFISMLIFWPLFCMKVDKKLSASMGLTPPWTPLGSTTLECLDPRYRLELRARHGLPPDKSWIRPCFNDHFYPRDAMLARVFATATCPSVCQSVCLSVTRRYCA